MIMANSYHDKDSTEWHQRRGRGLPPPPHCQKTAIKPNGEGFDRHGNDLFGSLGWFHTYAVSSICIFGCNGLRLQSDVGWRGTPVGPTHFGALDKPSHCFLELIETRSLSINGRNGTNKIETGNICYICAHIILQWKVILMYCSVSIMCCSVKWPPVVWAPQTAT